MNELKEVRLSRSLLVKLLHRGRVFAGRQERLGGSSYHRKPRYSGRGISTKLPSHHPPANMEVDRPLWKDSFPLGKGLLHFHVSWWEGRRFCLTLGCNLFYKQLTHLEKGVVNWAVEAAPLLVVIHYLDVGCAPLTTGLTPLNW